MFGASRQHVTYRIPELLENLKSEFESLSHDLNVYKMQRDEYERTLQHQLAEINNVQNSLYDLERRHTSLQKMYEEDYNRTNGKDGHIPNSTSDFPLRSLAGLSKDFMHQLNNNDGEGEKTPLPSLTNRLQPPPDSALKGPLPPQYLLNTSHPPSNADTIAPLPHNTNSLTGFKRPSESPSDIPYSHLPSQSLSFDNPALKMAKKEGMDHPSELEKTPSSFSEKNSSFPSISLNPLSSFPHPPHHEGPRNAETEDWNLRGGNAIDIELGGEIQHKSVVCCVKFSKDGEYVATGSNKKAMIISSTDGKVVKTFKEKNAKGGDLYFRSVCFSPDGKYLACGVEDKTIKLWDIEQEKVVHTFVSHTMDIYSVDYLNDGSLIVSGSGDKKVKVWDVQKGKCLYTLGNDEVGPKDGVTSVVVSPDRRIIAAGSLDRIIRLWDVETGTPLERFEGHLDSVYSVAFSMDGRSLASGSLDRTLKIWDISEPRRGKARSTLLGHNDFVLSVVFSPDDHWLVSGSKDRTVQFWDPRNSASYCKLEGHSNSVISVDINPVTSKFATGGGDSKAKLWSYKVTGGPPR